MANVEIVPVESTAQLNQFIKYPNKLYADDPNYVAPLISERKEFFDFKSNPFYRNAKVQLFLAMDGKTVTGRIATCINYTHNEFHGDQTGFFGFFDCPDDYDIAHPMLKVAMITLKKEGMDRMRGPMNFSTNHECGFLVEGFDSPPCIMMPYNQPYLPRLAERFGLKKVMDLLAYVSPPGYSMSERYERILKRKLEKAEVTVRPINMAKFDDEVRTINDIYTQAWESNWGFVPMPEDEFFHMARQMKQIVDPDLILIAEHRGRPVAFSMALPDINRALIHLNGRLLPFGIFKLLWHTKIRNKINKCRILTLGVIPEFRNRGIDGMLYVETYNRGPVNGYDYGEASWILETNERMRNALEAMGFVPDKRYRIVEMPL